MNPQRAITTLRVFNNEPFANGEVVPTEPVVLRNIAKQGYFSVEYYITPGCTFDLNYKISSNIDAGYITPADADPIGENLSGHGFLSFGPMIAPFMQIEATCTGGGSLTLFLNIA